MLRFSGCSQSVVELGNCKEEPEEPGDPLCSERSEQVELFRSMKSRFLGTCLIFEPQTVQISKLESNKKGTEQNNANSLSVKYPGI